MKRLDVQLKFLVLLLVGARHLLPVKDVAVEQP
jgi:hypothetical protein